MRRDPELEGFLALLATRRAPRTVEAYSRDLKHLGERLGKPVGSATTDDLRAYLAGLRADGLAPATISRRVSAVRAFFAHQVLLGARGDNPAAASISRSASPGESVFGRGRARRGSWTPAAGLSVRTPSSCRCR